MDYHAQRLEKRSGVTEQQFTSIWRANRTSNHETREVKEVLCLSELKDCSRTSSSVWTGTFRYPENTQTCCNVPVIYRVPQNNKHLEYIKRKSTPSILLNENMKRKYGAPKNYVGPCHGANKSVFLTKRSLTSTDRMISSTIGMTCKQNLKSFLKAFKEAVQSWFGLPFQANVK